MMENNFTLTRRKAMGFAATGLAAQFISKNSFAATAPVLVELFTSQGCSSCPPADKFAASLINQPNVICVSFNVDYWDYLGWRDTLASPDYTKRQMQYAQSRGDHNVYTPQMVIGGAKHVVGSNISNVNSAVDEGKNSATSVLNVSQKGDDVTIEMPTAISENSTLWILSVAPAIQVKIERGENSGSTIVYHNAVRKLTNAGIWDGKSATISVARKDITAATAERYIAVLQTGIVGPVIGLATFT